jgi:heat-inducible transcriptional repressor
MTTPALDERSREVLRQLIDLHILTGEPVGSESLARALNRAVSSATLRNIMADLEALGFLNHPHTSAGRMPTDEGYRLYVDRLMEARPLPADHAQAIKTELIDVSPPGSGEGLPRALRLSGQVGFVLTPGLRGPASGTSTWCGCPTAGAGGDGLPDRHLVTNKVVEIEERLTQDQLQACANYLNIHFAGMSLEAIRARVLELMKKERALYDSLLKSVIAVGEHAFDPGSGAADLYLDGTSNMLDPKVFEDLDRMKALFKTFEEKSRLVRVLNACMAQDGLRVVIGREPRPGDAGTARHRQLPLEGEAAWPGSRARPWSTRAP